MRQNTIILILLPAEFLRAPERHNILIMALNDLFKSSCDKCVHGAVDFGLPFVKTL
jgi:hypothetical protein